MQHKLCLSSLLSLDSVLAHSPALVHFDLLLLIIVITNIDPTANPFRYQVFARPLQNNGLVRSRAVKQHLCNSSVYTRHCLHTFPAQYDAASRSA